MEISTRINAQYQSDYRTAVHGLELTHLSGHPGARRFEIVQEAVRTQIAGKIIIGHCLWDSFELLQLSHPACDTRDVATFAPFRRSLGFPLSGDVWSCDDCPSLKDVMRQVMRRHIRLGYDSTVCHASLPASVLSYSPVERERESLHGLISVSRGCLGRRDQQQPLAMYSAQLTVAQVLHLIPIPR